MASPDDINEVWKLQVHFEEKANNTYDNNKKYDNNGYALNTAGGPSKVILSISVK